MTKLVRDTAEIRFLAVQTRSLHAFLQCGHLDFESAVTAQNDEFKASFDSSYSRQNLAKKLST